MRRLSRHVVAWYVVVDTGHALGALAAVLPTLLAGTFGLTDAAGHMWTLVGCGLVVMLAAIPYLLLSRPSSVARCPSERMVKWT